MNQLTVVCPCVCAVVALLVCVSTPVWCVCKKEFRASLVVITRSSYSCIAYLAYLHLYIAFWSASWRIWAYPDLYIAYLAYLGYETSEQTEETNSVRPMWGGPKGAVDSGLDSMFDEG